jgi:hypothetical protein
VSRARCGCGREWAGLNQAHCTLCHAHFSTVAHFDAHQPSYNGCLEPGDLTDRNGQPRLKPVDGPYGTTWVQAKERPAQEEMA